MDVRFQLSAALSAAEAHIQIAAAPFGKINDGHKLHVKGDYSADYIRSPGELSAIVTNVSLAIEMFLKILRAQSSGVIPKGHDLLKLWQRLPKNDKEYVKEEYERQVDGWLNTDLIKTISINFAGKSESKSSLPSKNANIAIKNHAKCFEQWRYFYENMHVGSNKRLVFNFAEAYSIAFALRARIKNFPGNMQSTMTIGPKKNA